MFIYSLHYSFYINYILFLILFSTLISKKTEVSILGCNIKTELSQYIPFKNNEHLHNVIKIQL